MYQYPPRQDGRVDEKGNPLAATIADLTVEPVLKAGDVVEVPCDICEGDPGYRSPIGNPDKCWRCHGKSKVTLTVPAPAKCPGCKEDLTGEQISRKSMSCYGATHFGNEIGLYANDMAQAWMCPHCSCRWSRWDGRILDPEEPIEMLHREYEVRERAAQCGECPAAEHDYDPIPEDQTMLPEPIWCACGDAATLICTHCHEANCIDCMGGFMCRACDEHDQDSTTRGGSDEA